MTSDRDVSPVLAGRTVVLGVSGGIAAYKAVEVCRQLVDAGAHVVPVLTADAQRFVGSLTFSALASEPAQTRLFDAPDPIPHTRLGRRADLVVVAPATATLLAKYAAGIADDLLTATLLATGAPVLLAPAMHTEMWEHPAVRANVATLSGRGVHLVGPDAGHLAGGDTGPGRLVDPAVIVDAAADVVRGAPTWPAGPSSSPWAGPANPSTRSATSATGPPGKMGTALAAVAARRGAHVTLVTTADLPVPAAVDVVPVSTAEEMADAVLARFPTLDAVVMAAAVADFRPKVAAPEKLKKGDGVPELLLEPTPDILAALGAARHDQVLVGFAAETERLHEHAAAKLAAKHLDLVVANDVSAPDAGFEVDTNRAVLLDSSGSDRGAGAPPETGPRGRRPRPRP